MRDTHALHFRRVWLGLCLVASGSVIGCGGHGENPTVVNASTTCEFDGSDRWSPSARTYQRTVSVGSNGDPWFVNVAGIHVSPDDVYIFDAGDPAVLRFSHDLKLRHRFGQRGEGPGEFQTHHRLSSTERGGFRRLDGDGSTVAVFDRWRVSLFDRNGRFDRTLISVSPELGLSSMPARISLIGEGVLYGSGGYDVMLRRSTGHEDPIYSVKYWHAGLVRDIVQLVLAPLPVLPNGVTFAVPNQARPMWDASGGCVVASDGESPWLVVSSLAAESVDTIALPLPDRDPLPADPEVISGLLPSTGTRSYPAPTAIRRIEDLVIDPDGNVWVLPIQPKRGMESGVEVIRVSLATGQATVDTVPRFPREFGAPAVYYATTRDELDRVIVERYELGGAERSTLAAGDVHP